MRKQKLWIIKNFNEYAIQQEEDNELADFQELLGHINSREPEWNQNPSARAPKASVDQEPNSSKTQVTVISCFWNLPTSQLPLLHMYAYNILPYAIYLLWLA